MKEDEFEPKTGEVRHLRKYRMSIPFFVNLCAKDSEHHFKVIENGIPEGAQVVHSYIDHHTMIVHVVLEHESFSPIAEGKPIPQGDYVTFKNLKDF